MRLTLPPILAVAAGVAACAPGFVRTDFDPEVSFASFKTYQWTDSSPTRRQELEGTSPFLERRLRRAVDLGLEQRGFRVAGSSGSPDFLITAFVVGPSRSDGPWRAWAATRCIGSPRVGVAIGYPFGLSRRVPWYRYRSYYRWDPWGYACSYRLGFGYVWLPLYDTPSDRTPGTLVIDVIDPASNELLWRGWAEGALFDVRTGPSQEEVDEVVNRVLERFPPGTQR
jgi:hypothetical protein